MEVENFVDEQTLLANCEGDLEKRIAIYDEAILATRHAYLLYNRGNAKLDSGRFEEAILDYDEALALEPTDADALYNRGLAKIKLGQYDAAITDCNLAIALQPNEASNYYNRGCAYALLSNTEACISSLMEAFQLGPKWISTAKTDSDFDRIRNEPAFINFMSEFTGTQ